MTRGFHRSQAVVTHRLRALCYACAWRMNPLLCVFLAIFILASCSPESSNTTSQAPAPGTVARITAPAAPSAMDTFRALAPARGLKFTPLFIEPIDDSDARFKRLEDAVQALRNDFDTVVPSMVRLVAIEKDMKELVGQLQSLTENPVEEVPPLPSDAVTPPPLPPEDEAEAESSATENLPAVTATPAPEQQSAPAATATPNSITGEDVAKPQEAVLKPTPAQTDSLAMPSSPVTPGAVPKGMPPEGTAPLSILAPSTSQTSNVTSQPSSPIQLTPQNIAPTPTAPNQPAPVTAPPAKPAVKAEAAPATPVTQGVVSAVRIGDHKEKTRIVIDMTGKPTANAVMSVNGKQLIIDMRGWDWGLAKEWLADNSQLVAAWEYKDGYLIVDVIYASQIKSQSVLQPNGKPGYRLVIDLFCPDVHQ